MVNYWLTAESTTYSLTGWWLSIHMDQSRLRVNGEVTSITQKHSLLAEGNHHRPFTILSHPQPSLMHDQPFLVPQKFRALVLMPAAGTESGGSWCQPLRARDPSVPAAHLVGQWMANADRWLVMIGCWVMVRQQFVPALQVDQKMAATDITASNSKALRTCTTVGS